MCLRRLQEIIKTRYYDLENGKKSLLLILGQKWSHPFCSRSAKFCSVRWFLQPRKEVKEFDRILTLRKSERTLQFSTSVEVRLGVVSSLVRPSVRLSLFLENRSKDFYETWKLVRDRYYEETDESFFGKKIWIIQ